MACCISLASRRWNAMIFTPADKRGGGAFDARQRERDRKFADSPLEEAVTSEPVSGIPIPWLQGKIQGNSLELRCSPLGKCDRSGAYTLNSLVTKQGIFQGM